MSTGGANHVLREYDRIVQGKTSGWQGGTFYLQTQSFEALTALIERETEREDPSNLNPVATFGREQGRPSIRLQQWVGALRLPDGTTLEILPKTHQRGDDLRACREVLLRMLSVTNERFREAPSSDLNPAKQPLFEVFLAYALAGFRAALRRGVPHAYVTVEDERAGLRGRLNLSRQVRQLPSRAHLLHVTYDEYLPDRPETRLVRKSVEHIARLTTSEGTRRLARETLRALDGVPPSRDVRADLGAWRLERGNAHFAPLESLVRLILFELNPLASGESVRAVSVLFDMNKVYEAYVAWLLRCERPDWAIRTQMQGKSLGTFAGQPVFRLRPDLHITLPSGEIIIADTKWKRLENAPRKAYGVSQADAYQMLAYSEIFQCANAPETQHLWLIYPHTADLSAVREPIHLGTGSERQLHVLTVDLQGNHASWPLPQPSLSIQGMTERVF